MSNWDHILLYSIVFSSFTIFTIKISKKTYSRKEIIKLFLIPALIYALVESLRYNRGVDYLHYEQIYKWGYTEGTQFLFDLLNNLLNSIGLDFSGALFVYEIILLIGICWLISSYSVDIGKWMYFLAILAMLNLHENLIRQYVALPLIFCSIYYMFQKKWLIMFLFIVCANFIHSGTIFVCPVILLFYYAIKKTIPWHIAIGTLFLTYFILSIDASSLFLTLLQKLNIGAFIYSEHLMHYIEDSDRWLGKDSVLANAQQTLVTKTMQFLFESGIIISSYIAFKIQKERKIQCFYNIIVFAFVLCRLVHGYEILSRIFNQLYIFWFIPLGCALYVLNNKRSDLKSTGLLNAMRFNVFIAIGYLVLYWGRFIFFNPKAVFIWD